jgi:hypothetical protein
MWKLVLTGIPAGIFSLLLPVAIFVVPFMEGLNVVTSMNILMATFFLSLSGAISLRYIFVEKGIKQSLITMSAGIALFVFALSFSIPEINAYMLIR